MSDLALHVDHLSKSYRIPRVQEAQEAKRYKTLQEDLLGLPRGLWSAVGRRNGSPRETFWALRGASFDVNHGEVVGIIGRNGAGKSTLLKILSRITEPTEGRADVYGRVGSLLEVGTGFHPELTGRENVFLNGAILGMRRSEIRSKFDEIVAFSEVEAFIDTPVKFYSSGMYVRLAFAVAAHLDPEILLVDEVLAVGDSQFQKKCLGKMGDIGRAGRTVLLVTHNMPSVANLCARAILLNGGEVVADGPTSDVIQQYLASGAAFNGEVVWPDPERAPGNGLVRLNAVRILQDGVEGPTAEVGIAKEVCIEITYWNLIENSILYPCVWLRDHMGTLLFSSSNHSSISLTDDPWYGRPHPTGLFRSICRIPGNFLNEGHYSVAAIVGKGISDTQILEDRILSFQVYDTGEMRQEYHGTWGGALRPRLPWHTEYIGPATRPLEEVTQRR